MLNDDITIGVKLKTHLYLTIPNDGGKVPFDVESIVDVKPTENGSIVTMLEPSGPFSSKMSRFEYEVEDNSEKIQEAIKDALGYKMLTLEYLNGVLDK